MRPLNELALQKSLLKLVFSLESLSWGRTEGGDYWIEWRSNGIGKVHGPSFESCLKGILESENAKKRLDFKYGNV